MRETRGLTGELHLLPPGFQLIGTEVGQDMAIDIDAGGFALTGEFMHLGTGFAITGDVEHFVFHVVVFEPVDGFVTPRQPGLMKRRILI